MEVSRLFILHSIPCLSIFLFSLISLTTRLFDSIHLLDLFENECVLGPGCRELIGMGTEQGPFFIHANGTLAPNPFSWNKAANMLYIEQPAGVGFSYSERVKDYTTGDAEAASDMYLLIREFLTRYPERRSNEFYIASESYGGML